MGIVGTNISLDPATWDAAELADFGARACDGPKPTSKGRRWAVAAEHPYASLTGQRVLEAGGSAADAYVAVAAVLHVVMPGTTTLGGVFGGIYFNAATSEPIAINAGLSLPLAETTLGSAEDPWVHLDMKGTGRAVLVPGVIRGLEDLHCRFGKLTWADLWLPAIHFARHGFPMYELYWKNLDRRKDVLLSREGGRAAYLPTGELPPREGQYRQVLLAETLEQIAAQGADYCYSGDWAKQLVEAVQDAGGRMTMEDLSRHATRWDTPVSANYLGHELFTSPPPHFGGVSTLVGLQVLEELGTHLQPPPWQSAESLLTHIQVFKATMMIPAAMVDLRRANPEQRTAFAEALSPTYAKGIADYIRATKVLPALGTPGSHSHNIVIVDGEGSIMTSTFTIHSDSWGDSGIVIGGISLNSSAMQVATVQVPGGERIFEPLSAYIAFKDGKPVLASTVIGSGLMGCQLQNTENVLGRAMSLQDSCAAPRYGFYELNLAELTMTDKIQVEPFEVELLDAVEQAGQPLLRMSFRWEGHAHADVGYWAAIGISADGEYEAVVDPRLPGLSLAG